LANSCVTINAPTCLEDIATALTNKYGAGVTIYSLTTNLTPNYLIFSCAAISSKVIKIAFNPVIGAYSAYYGDAWTSGSTITNQVRFLYSGTATGTLSSFPLVLGDNFILLNSLSSNSNVNSQLSLIAIATNGDSMVFGLTGAVDNTIDCAGKDISLNLPINIITFGYGGFCGVSNYLYKVPLLIADSSSGTLISNTDGSPAGITDLYVSSYGGVSTAMVLGSNSLLTTCLMYNENTTLKLHTALMAEW